MLSTNRTAATAPLPTLAYLREMGMGQLVLELASVDEPGPD